MVLLDPAALGARYPWLSTGDLAGGSLGQGGEGWFDPHALLHGFRRKALSLGVTYRAGQAVALRRQGRRVNEVTLADGSRLCADWFEHRLWPALAHRVPGFEAARLMSSWAGHYDVNLLDANAILGPHPDVDNLLFANGFSGHGLQHSPAAGRALSEWIVHGGYRSLDLSALGWERVIQQRPPRELNVV